MCLVHLTLLAGARRQERPLPKLVKAFVNKRHQYFGLEPMHIIRIQPISNQAGTIQDWHKRYIQPFHCIPLVHVLGLATRTLWVCTRNKPTPARAIWKSCCYSIQELLIDFIFIQ